MQFIILKRLILIIFMHAIMLVSVVRAEEKELNIHSDSLTIDKEKGRAIFSGKVSVVFRDMKLKTEKIEVIYAKSDKGDKIDKIIIPRKLRIIKNCGNEAAIAKKGVFDATNNRLELAGDVILEKDDKILKTNILVYHTTLDL